MIAWINKPFSQNPNSYFFQNWTQLGAVLHVKKYESYRILPARTVSTIDPWGRPHSERGAQWPAIDSDTLGAILCVCGHSQILMI